MRLHWHTYGGIHIPIPCLTCQPVPVTGPGVNGSPLARKAEAAFFTSPPLTMSGFSSPVVLTALALIVSYAIYTLSQVGRREPALPLGPPTVPILGNLHQIPLTGFHKK